jgi:hypothetical protein
MPYGVDNSVWNMLPSDDQAAIKATATGQPIPQIGGYYQPTPGDATPPPSLMGGGGVASTVKVKVVAAAPKPEALKNTLAAREAIVRRRTLQEAQPQPAQPVKRKPMPQSVVATSKPTTVHSPADRRLDGHRHDEQGDIDFPTDKPDKKLRVSTLSEASAPVKAAPRYLARHGGLIAESSQASVGIRDRSVPPTRINGWARGAESGEPVTNGAVRMAIYYKYERDVPLTPRGLDFIRDEETTRSLSANSPEPGPSPAADRFHHREGLSPRSSRLASAQAVLKRLPKWMLEGKAPPPALAKDGKLPKALTLAANPEWHTPAGREHFAFEYLRHALHLSGFQAAALVGNMAIESRKLTQKRSIDLVPGLWQQGTPKSTHTVTSPRAGFGIAQWTYPARKEALRSFAGQHWGNFAVELAFVAHELKYPHEVVRGLPVDLIQRDTLSKLQHSRSPDEATAIVMAVYEHPNTYLSVPPFRSVVKLLGEFNAGYPQGPNPSDPSGYRARLAAAKKIAKAYG